jgi:hypothetical protein
MSAVLVVFPVISATIIIRNRKNLTSETFQKKYGSLFEKLGTQSLWKSLWNVWFMVKRAITVVIILYMSEYPCQQLQLLLVLSVLQSALIIKIEPY